MPLLAPSRRISIFSALLLATAAAWHAYLCFPGSRIGSALFVFSYGLTPYLVLAALAPWIARLWVLLISAGILVWSDVDAGIDAMRPGSSTNVVALGVQPLFGLGVVLLTAMVAGVLHWIGSPLDD